MKLSLIICKFSKLHHKRDQQEAMMPNTSMKKVTFNPKVTGIQILNIDDFTPKEIFASWYDEEEMERITQRCFKILQNMEAGNAKKYCVRGLEGHSSVGSISKKSNRTTALAAVLMEQARQWDENRFNDQAIADAYRRTTSSCQLWAQVVGKRDEEVAEAINEDSDEVNTPIDAPPSKVRSTISVKFDEHKSNRTSPTNGYPQNIRAVAA